MINQISGISNLYSTKATELLKTKAADETTTGTTDLFKMFLDSAKEMVQNTDALQKDADKATLDFIVGDNDNIHEVLIAQEKALIALQFTTELTNKSIDAYKEIMRMQI